MRIQHRYLTWESTPQKIKSIIKILDTCSVEYHYKEDITCIIPTFRYELEFNLYEDMALFETIQQNINKFDLTPQISTEFEKNDFEKAEWFLVEAGAYQYPQPDGDFGYLNVTFDLENYCPSCGTGKIQNAPFRLYTEPKQKNNQFWGLYWERDAIFVREAAKNILEKENIAGIRFLKVLLHKKNIEIDGFYQLHTDIVLNKGFDDYNAMTITCKFNNEEDLILSPNFTCTVNNKEEENIDRKYCGRMKYQYTSKGGYCFDKKIFNSKFDIVRTYEYFGTGAYARQFTIVSKKFKALVEQNKLKGLNFEPIMHERFEKLNFKQK